MQSTSARGIVFLFLLAACDRGAPEPSSTPSASVSVAVDDEEEANAIIASIQSAQRDGIERRKPDAFMRIWAADGRYVQGRGERPDRYDWSLGRDEIERAIKARSRGKPELTRKLAYSHEVMTRDGDQVTVRWRVDHTWRAVDGDAGAVDSAEELWRLRRTAEGWRVVENRLWPTGRTDSKGTTVFDEAHWREADAAVEKARASGDHNALLDALVQAARWPEAFELAKQITEAKPKDAMAWLNRARVAELLRRIDEAIASFEQTRKLDPKAPIPAWVAP